MRDWRAFGAFSAFLGALFTELYGFPLTIYLLSGWMSTTFPGIDFLSHDAGQLLEMMFGGKANPHFGPFQIASHPDRPGLRAPGQGLDRAVAGSARTPFGTAGRYAHIRHPQYVSFVAILLDFLLQWPAP